jgi:hypothetical protein
MLFRTPALLVTGVLIAACGSTQGDPPVAAADPGAAAATTPPPAGDDAADAGPEVDHGAPSDVYPAPHPDMPQVVSAGGPVLKAPRVVPIFFKNDPLKTELLAFANKVGASKYWAANTTEYGVGALTAADAIELDDVPPADIDDVQIEDFLRAKLDGTHPEFGTIDANTIYTIYYPASTTITLGGGGGGGASKSCESFGGYHDSAAVGTKFMVYAVVPECPDFGGLNGIDAVTSTSSHEWIEASTDPNPMIDPAYASVDDDHAAWAFLLGGSETGDMCAQNQDSFYQPADLGFYVQRSWSNEAAKAGHNPCVPAIGSLPYFNSAPVLPDTLKIAGAPPTKGIKIPIGESRTVEVDLFSDAPTDGPWTVKARPLDHSSTPTIQLSLDRDHGQNGEKIYLTIKALAASPYKASVFMLSSRLGQSRTSWVGVVGN